MANINEILQRAASLRDETALNSISPERAGGIMYDTLIALNELWLQQGSALVISKIYASVSAMEADTAPVSDLTGQPLRPGQIVVIASSDSDNGSVYRYNGTTSPSWTSVGKIGNLEPVDSLDSDSTSLPLAAHQGKVLDGKISQLGQEMINNISELEIVFGYIAFNNTWATAASQVNLKNNRSVIYPVISGTNYLFKSVSSSIIAFLSSIPDTWTSGMDMSQYYASDGGGRIGIDSAGRSGFIPDNAKYVIVTELVNNVDWSLSTMVISGYDYRKCVITNIGETNQRVSHIEDTILRNGAIYYDAQFILQEVYFNPELFTIADIERIDRGTFYNAFASDGKYITGIIFRDSNNNTIVDGRVWYATQQEAKNAIGHGFFNLPQCKYLIDATNTTDGAAKTLYGLSIGKSSLEIYNNERILDFLFVENNTAGAELVTPTTHSGYINENGQIVTSANYVYTEPIYLHAGDELIVYGNAGSAALLCEKTKTGYKPLVVSAFNAKTLYTYIADKGIDVVVSYVVADGAYINIIPNDKVELSTPINWNINQFATLDGAIVGTASAFGISDAIKVYKGDIVKLRISATENLTAVISTSDETGKVLNPKVAASSDAMTLYTYVVENSGYVVVSGNTGTFTKPTLSIIRQMNLAKAFDNWKIGFGGERNFKERNYYKGVAIPENYNSVLCYHADNKSLGNHINNAVVYPDGTIIACRSNGKVVKITSDGTETTLLTISGAWDWRGMYIDKNYNVYVSPHNSIAGSLLSMSDRGLYRLAYNENQFIKVLSLYNPSSTIPTEAQENDDTIWTMCEDNFGRLYAGVYAHSVRANPSVYRSDDGGVTWTIVCNLLTEGYTQSGWLGEPMHIHDIIYNQYNNALYCIVGEVNTIYKSIDLGESWIDLNTPVQQAKGTTLIAVPDGVLVGSDGLYQGVISKLYSDDKTVRTVGEMWHAEFFGMRRSDLTGWIYAFTKIESGINQLEKYPPIDANTDSAALANWKSNANPGKLKTWEMYNEWVTSHYSHDSIHPVNAAILVSKDNGETWEIIYKEDTHTSEGAGMGIFCVGYFKNGECLCGIAIEDDGSKTFSNPVIVREGKYKWTDGNINLDGDAFIVTNLDTMI